MLIVLWNHKSGVIQSCTLFISITYEILIENIPRVHSLPKTIQILYETLFMKRKFMHTTCSLLQDIIKTNIGVAFARQ